MNYQSLLGPARADDLSAANLRNLAASRFERSAPVPFRERWARLRAAMLPLICWTLACGGLALTYCLLAPPKFLVTTDVVLEPPQPVVSTDSSAQSTAPTLDSALADSQVQILMSERNLSYVFDAQNLQADPEFSNSGFDPIGWLLNRIPFLRQPPLPPEEQAKRDRLIAFGNFANQVSVKRLAQSYAFELSYYADSPAKAKRLANAITAAYIRDKVLYNIAAAAAQRGGDFLQNRISDTKAEVDAADNAVKTGVIPDFIFGHADARIISSAVEPLKKTYPRTTLIVLLATAVGLVLGVVGLIARDELDRRVRSGRRLQAVTGVSALAVIPRVKAARSRPAAMLRLASSSRDSRFAREIRKMRIAALQIEEPGRFPAVGVLSFRRGEGRSAIAANLASVLAGVGSPVTLVDADIFNPALTKAFAPDVRRGLADCVLIDPDPGSMLAPVEPNLSLLPARCISTEPDPNAVVTFKTTTAVCAALAASHCVVVDLPPVSESPESAAIARGLSGVFAVVDAQSVTVDEFLELLDRLSENDVRVLGVVLNKAELS